jgi:phage tail tape-measure protein
MSGISSGAALGGSIGSVIPGVGTAIGTVGGAILGGIFGGLGSSAAKREAERQKMIAINRTNALNAQNREMAYTTGLRNRFARENVTDDTQSLFHAEKGVEGAVNPLTGQTYRHYTVNTAYGKANGP